MKMKWHETYLAFFDKIELLETKPKYNYYFHNPELVQRCLQTSSIWYAELKKLLVRIQA